MKITYSVSLVIALTLASCKDDQPTAQGQVVRPVRTMLISSQEQFSQRKFPGRAIASNSVTLAFEVSGKINELPVQVGDRVKKGEVLAKLDSRDFKNALDQATAELKRTEAQFLRMKRALKDNAVSKQEVTNAEAAYDSAKAAVKIRQKALADTRLVAPYDGIVAAKFVKNFGNIQAKQQAIRLVDPTKIEMTGDIPEDLISLARRGMKVLVKFDAFPDITITSTISEIGTEASQATRTYPVTLIMDQPESVTILPGMSGNAWRSQDAKIANTPEDMRGHDIPLSAILKATDGKSYVWIISSDGIASRKEIVASEITKRGVLVQGLAGGEVIATAGVNHLVEGQKVRLLD